MTKYIKVWPDLSWSAEEDCGMLPYMGYGDDYEIILLPDYVETEDEVDEYLLNRDYD